MEAEAAEASAPETDRQPEQAGAACTSKALAEKLPLQEGPAEPEHKEGEDLGWDVEDEWETDSEDEQDDDSMPSYEFRVETAKLLIELDEGNHAAVQVHLCACSCNSPGFPCHAPIGTAMPKAALEDAVILLTAGYAAALGCVGHCTVAWHLTYHVDTCCAHALLDMLISEGKGVRVGRHLLELVLRLPAADQPSTNSGC